MTPATEAWLFALSLGASAVGGALGMASGIFIVPLLTGILGMDIRVAVGASLVSVIACSCGSAASFLRGGLPNIRLAIVLEVATTLGAASGVMLSGIVPTTVLYGIFALVLVVSGWQMLARRNANVFAPVEAAAGSWTRRLDADYFEPAANRRVAYVVDRLSVGMVLMYAAGLLSALLGIGSGVLKIPAMDSALKLPIKVSSATSNFMIGVTATASAGAYFLRGVIVTDVAGPVVLGSVIGALLGARLLMLVSNEKLRAFYVIALFALAVQMLLAATGIHLGAGSG